MISFPDNGQKMSFSTVNYFSATRDEVKLVTSFLDNDQKLPFSIIFGHQTAKIGLMTPQIKFLWRRYQLGIHAKSEVD